MKKKLVLLGLMMFLGLSFAFTQNKQITGTVTSSEDGLGFPGVSVIVKGTSIGISTDINGKYTLMVPVDATTLVFTFVGMKQQEVAISGNVINVVMEPETKALDEVVVVGYGVRSKRNLISSVSKVDAKEISKVSIASLDGALQGSTPGLVVMQNSGAPGTGMSVRVRGVTSISGSNQPLYVIDGVPVITGNMVSDDYGGQGGNGLTNLSPTDIQSVEVLKDASAAAIYGASASNGVVLITTKKGKTGDAKIEFNYSYGVQNPIKKYETMGVGEYYKWADKAYTVLYPTQTSRLSYLQGWVSGNNLTEADAELANFYATDTIPSYLSRIYRKNTPVQEASVGVSGGTESTQYYAGFSNFKQEGTLMGQDYNRYSVRLNIDQRANKWLKIFGNVSYSLEDINRINGDNNIFGPIPTGVLERPGWDVYNEDGSFSLNRFTFSNPVQMAVEVDGNTNSSRIIGNGGFKATIIEGLTFNSTFGIDRVDFKERRYKPATTSWGIGTNGTADFYANMYQRFLTSENLSYNKTFGKINIDAIVGVEYQKTEQINSWVQADNFPSPAYRWAGSGTTAKISNATQTENNLLSQIGRIGLSYADKYLFEASFRADASSRFGKDKRTGYFPAASVGWKVHNESWFPVKAINELKLRTSYGLTGNTSGLDDFQSRSIVTSTQYAAVAGYSVTRLGYSGLSWETTSQLNAGFDLGVFNDRLRVEYSYYSKKTKDLLLDSPLPGSSGFTTIVRNIGEMTNKGHEITLSGRILTGDLGWTSTLNIATLKNEITKLYKGPDGNYQPVDYGFASRVEVGQSLGAFYVYQTDGLTAAGDVNFVDRSGDGSITAADLYFAGKPLPDYSGNFANTFSYKGIELSINFQFSQGFEIFNNSLEFAGATGSPTFGKFKSVNDYWTTDNTDAKQPRPATGAVQASNNKDQDNFVEDGSYVRLKNVTMGYIIPKKLVKFASIRVWVGADNLKTWTKYSGCDPEVNTFGAANVAAGTDMFTQGLNTTVKFGLNITF